MKVFYLHLVPPTSSQTLHPVSTMQTSFLIVTFTLFTLIPFLFTPTHAFIPGNLYPECTSCRASGQFWYMTRTEYGFESLCLENYLPGSRTCPLVWSPGPSYYPGQRPSTALPPLAQCVGRRKTMIEGEMVVLDEIIWRSDTIELESELFYINSDFTDIFFFPAQTTSSHLLSTVLTDHGAVGWHNGSHKVVVIDHPEHGPASVSLPSDDVTIQLWYSICTDPTAPAAAFLARYCDEFPEFARRLTAAALDAVRYAARGEAPLGAASLISSAGLWTPEFSVVQGCYEICANTFSSCSTCAGARVAGVRCRWAVGPGQCVSNDYYLAYLEEKDCKYATSVEECKAIDG